MTACLRVLLVTLIAGWISSYGLRAANFGDLIYEAGGDSAVITGCQTSASGHLEIPDTLEGKPVRTIGESAFFNCHNISSVKLSNNVTEVGNFAFFGLRGLQTVEFGSGVRAIGTRAFNSCTSLERIAFGNQISTIGDSAFERCSKIPSVHFPATVSEIAQNAFRYCSQLSRISFEGNAPSVGENAFDSIGLLPSIQIQLGATGFDEAVLGVPVDVLAGQISYHLDGDEAVVSGCNPDATGSIEILASIDSLPVTSIGLAAFEGCRGVTKVTFPESITRIQTRAFRDCTGLTEVRLPAAVTRIDDDAFDGCTSLKTLTLSEELLTIDDGAFRACTSLEQLHVPDNVTQIGNSAFEECTGLKTIVLGERVTNLGQSAFAFCSNLESVEFGPRVRFFRAGIFEGCDNLTSVTFTGNAPTVRGNFFSQINSDLTVYAEPDSRGFRATLGGAPVVFLDGSQVPITIQRVRIDIAGNFVIRLDGNNTLVELLHAPNLGADFVPADNVSIRGNNELVVAADSPELQSGQAFFRVARR